MGLMGFRGFCAGLLSAFLGLLREAEERAGAGRASSSGASYVTFTLAGVAPNPRKPDLGFSNTSTETLSRSIFSSRRAASMARSMVLPVAVMNFSIS